MNRKVRNTLVVCAGILIGLTASKLLRPGPPKRQIRVISEPLGVPFHPLRQKSRTGQLADHHFTGETDGSFSELFVRLQEFRAAFGREELPNAAWLTTDGTYHAVLKVRKGR